MGLAHIHIHNWMSVSAGLAGRQIDVGKRDIDDGILPYTVFHECVEKISKEMPTSESTL
jgi:hypothetical protein